MPHLWQAVGGATQSAMSGEGCRDQPTQPKKMAKPKAEELFGAFQPAAGYEEHPDHSVKGLSNKSSPLPRCAMQAPHHA